MDGLVLQQVISGAQIGTDIAALRAAAACGISTGGFMPKGRRTTNGPLPLADFLMYGLVETANERYPERTEKNVKVADATLLLAYNWSSPGEKLTKRLIAKHKKPSFGVTLEKVEGRWRLQPWGGSVYIGSTPQPRATREIYNLVVRHYAKHVAMWVWQTEAVILNVAGNGNEEIEECVQHFLMLVFAYLKEIDP